MDYNVIIEQGRSKENDAIIDFLANKLKGKRYVDIGTNCGYLLDKCPGGVGCDLSPMMVKLATDKGHNVILADACNLPYKDKSYEVSVLSCVLEQIEDWEKALAEAIRVSDSVIGIFPIKDRSPWGIIGGTVWVKSVIGAEELIKRYSASIYPYSKTHYYFEITKRGL